MTYIYLLISGVQVSVVHFYLIWKHRDNLRYSISEHAILDAASHKLYIASHLFCDVFFLVYAYIFFVTEQQLAPLFGLAVVFAVLDAVQAAMPSRDKTEKAHFAAAYVSWVAFILLGVISLFALELSAAVTTVAAIILIPILVMFLYMHINQSKLYPYQLTLVPLYIIYMLILTVSAA